MKKFIFTIITVLVFSIFVFSQAKADDPKEWKSFSPAAEEFTVKIPDDLQASAFNEKNINRRYTGLFNGTYYFIFSDGHKNEYQYNTVLKFIEENQNAELESQKNNDVMKFSFSDDEDFHHTILLSRTKKRAYVFHLVSPDNNNPDVIRFFENLKIIIQPAPVNAGKEIKEIETSGNPDQMFGTNGSERGRGFAADNAYDPKGTENRSIQSSPTLNTQNKNLEITYKPKPFYTDFARFYDITGDVKMRVTFTMDGTIGDTTPVTKLPFGLTKSAVTAAKQLRFDPRVIDGKAVHVTKTVVYTFTIY